MDNIGKRSNQQLILCIGLQAIIAKIGGLGYQIIILQHTQPIIVLFSIVPYVELERSTKRVSVCFTLFVLPCLFLPCFFTLLVLLCLFYPACFGQNIVFPVSGCKISKTAPIEFSSLL